MWPLRQSPPRHKAFASNDLRSRTVVPATCRLRMVPCPAHWRGEFYRHYTVNPVTIIPHPLYYLVNLSPSFSGCSLIDRLDQAFFRDDAGDQAGRRHVEGGVVDLDAVRGGLPAEAVGDLAADRAARWEWRRRWPGVRSKVLRRGGDVERDAVGLGQEGDAVGADLVGGVAVGGDAVGADDDQLRRVLPSSPGRPCCRRSASRRCRAAAVPRRSAGPLAAAAGSRRRRRESALPCSAAVNMTARAVP